MRSGTGWVSRLVRVWTNWSFWKIIYRLERLATKTNSPRLEVMKVTKYSRTAVCREQPFATREVDGNLYIEGYFAVFGSEYELWDGVVETVDGGAFDETIGGDIRALVNHDTTLVLGRTSAGTLRLEIDETGLFGSITVNQNDQDAMNLYERVKRGDVSQCSFGFDILEEEKIRREDGSVIFILKKVKLYEVSVVTFPAYEDTSVEVRRRDCERAAERWREEMKRRVKEA